VDPRAGLDDVEKRKFLTLPGLELRPLCCPACRQSLYRLSNITGTCLLFGHFRLSDFRLELVRKLRLKNEIQKCYISDERSEFFCFA
jgi:hypothetical protein